jgi:hypothetical protein
MENTKMVIFKIFKRVSIIVIIMLSSMKVFSQYGTPMKLFHTEKIKQTQTIVIVDYKEKLNKGIDDALSRAMAKVWKITTYQVLDKEEVISNYGNFKNTNLKNPLYSFIYITYGGSSDGNQPNDRRMILSFILTEKGSRNLTDPVTAIAQSEFNYDIYDRDAGLIKDLKLMQAQVENGFFVKDESADPSIKEKTLYIPVNLMEKGTEDKLKIYPYPYKIVSKDELSKAIKEHLPNLCFIEQTNIELPMMTVIDIETGRPLYHGQAGIAVTGFIQDLKLLKKCLK